MRVVRCRHEDSVVTGVVDRDGAIAAVAGDVYAGSMTTGGPIGRLGEVELLSPCEPSKILCVGRNYATAVRAKGHPWPDLPFVFLKTPNTVVGSEAEILRPDGIETFEYEGELTAVIGKTARQVSAGAALDYVFGYTCGNDMTVRDWQTTDPHWTRAKCGDTLCPLGPWIETELDPSDLSLQTVVNGELHQDGRTSDMIFSLGEIIAFISRTITLEPGDVILMGTPLGAHPVGDGDQIEVTIEGIGTLRNRVRQLPPIAS